MRILSRQAFLALPEGTVYSDYQPCVFGPLMIKEQTITDPATGQHIDFYEQDLNDIGAFEWEDGDSDLMMNDRLARAQETGESILLCFDCESREGLFDDSRLYAVWDRADVESLIVRLGEALRDGYSQ